MEICEMCSQERVVAWYCWDDNAEMELCRKCYRELKANEDMHGPIVPIH